MTPAGVLAAANGRALWYLTRGTGMVCLLLLTASVVLGILEVRRWARPTWPRFVTAGLHRNVSLLVVAFVAVHIVTSVVDSFAPIRWLDAIVPFASRYRPLWLGLGALAVDLLIAVTVTSLVRQRLGYGVWKAVHWLTYLCWPLAFVHGLGTGTDVRQGWSLAVSLVCLAAVVGSVWWRLAAGGSEWAGIRTGAACLSLAAPAVIVVWLFLGPLRPGWAARAGTPPTLLPAANGPPATPAPAGTAAAAAGLQPPFTAKLTGTLVEAGPDANGNGTITIDTTLNSGASGNLHILLSGPLDPQGISMTASSVTLGSTAQSVQYRGRVTRLQGTSLSATLAGANGSSLPLSVSLQIDQATGHVTGTLQAG